MNDDEFKEGLFLLAAFMLSSAKDLARTPQYGPFRLLDAAGRLLALMEARGLGDAYISSLRKDLDAIREGEMDDAKQNAVLDRLAAELGAELARRV